MYFSASEQPAYLEISFHSPDSANALSLKAALELRAIVREYKKWSRPVTVVSGHPRVFCSGGNLSDYAKLKSKAEGLKINREITKCLHDFGAWEPIKLALITGDVLGGGMEWLARFDYRWCTPTVALAFWQRRIGLSPGWGGGEIWSRKIGENSLRRLLQVAEPLNAASALRVGLIDRIYPLWRMPKAAEDFTRDLSGQAARKIGRWSAKSEAKIFSSLWMADEHATVLQNWKDKTR